MYMSLTELLFSYYLIQTNQTTYMYTPLIRLSNTYKVDLRIGENHPM